MDERQTKVAEGAAPQPPSGIDWHKVAELRRETDDRIANVERIAQRIGEKLNRRQS
jgi:hypothetical protein